MFRNEKETQLQCKRVTERWCHKIISKRSIGSIVTNEENLLTLIDFISQP